MEETVESSDSELGSDPEPCEWWDFGGPRMPKAVRKRRALDRKRQKRRCLFPSPTPMDPVLRRELEMRAPKPSPGPDLSNLRNALRERLKILRKLVEEIAPEMLDSLPVIPPDTKPDDDSKEKRVSDGTDGDEHLAYCTQQIEELFAKKSAQEKAANPVAHSSKNEPVASSSAQEDGRLKINKAAPAADAEQGTLNLLNDDNDDFFLSGDLSSF